MGIKIQPTSPEYEFQHYDTTDLNSYYLSWHHTDTMALQV
jgi:hypothetical protein